MKLVTPALKAYRDCGFHNRTLKELRESGADLRHAVLSEKDDRTAHVPNIFGSFQHDGITYRTTLTLTGIESPSEKILSNRSRGFSSVKARVISKTEILWEFKVLIPHQYCREELFPAEGPGSEAYTKFCAELKDRTDIFAMEFLCCYRFFMEQIQETYEKGTCEFKQPKEDRDLVNHPKPEEVQNLICTYDAVERHLDWFKEEYSENDWKFEAIDQFMDLHIGRKRRSMMPYYTRWIEQHRVDPELVEQRTIEYISMAFRECDYEN